MGATQPNHPANDSQTPGGAAPYWHSFVLSVQLSVDEKPSTFFGQSATGYPLVAKRVTHYVGLDPEQ